MRVLVLTHKDLLPPPGARARPPGARTVPWATEQDVLEGLARAGHTARVLGLTTSLAPLEREVARERPDAVLNLLEEFGDDVRRVPEVVRWLERRGLAVSGCDARALARADDKGRARRALARASLPLPPARVARRGVRHRPDEGLPWPRVVKSATRHGSEGLTQASVVASPRAEHTQVRWIQRHVGTDALVEAYVGGRELYVGVLAGRALAPCELTRRTATKGDGSERPWIATARTKWDPAYRTRLGLVYGPARRLAARSGRHVARVAVRAARALGVEEAARVDLRLDARGRAWVIEVNANPDLISWGEFATGAKGAGLGYERLLDVLLARALTRARRRPHPRARTARARPARAR